MGRAKEYANVILPITPAVETAGTFVNAEGAWQSFKAAVTPFEDARPGWKVLRVLANLLHLDGFDHVSACEVRDELQGQVAKMSAVQPRDWSAPMALGKATAELECITTWPIYRGDNLVRRAEPLQNSGCANTLAVRMSAATASKLGLEQGNQVIAKQGDFIATLPLEIDNTVADKCVCVPGGYPETAGLNHAFGAITVERSE